MTRESRHISPRHWMFLLLPLLLLGMMVGACRESEDSVPVVTFPEVQTLEGKAGDELTFHLQLTTADQQAADDAARWELSSGQPVWCRLSLGNQQDMPSVTGKGSEGDVRISISDDAETFGCQAKADLTLRINGQSQVVATVIRTDAQAYVIVHQDGREIHEGETLVIGSTGVATFTLNTNFGIPTLAHADWFDVCLQDGIYTLTLNEGHSPKYSIPADEGFIHFSRKDNKTIGQHTFRVCFTGMDEQYIKITGYAYQPDGLNVTYTMPVYNWTVSADGKRMTATRPNGDIVEVSGAMSITVDALDDRIVFAQLSGNRLEALTGKEWFHVTQDKSQVSITVDALTPSVTKREATLYAFPEAQWRDISELSEPDIDDYANRVIFSFVQQVEAAGFQIEYYNWNTYEMGEVTVESETDKEMIAQVHKLAANVQSIYTANLRDIPVNVYSRCKALTVRLLMSQDEWDSGTNQRNYALMDLTTGADYTADKAFSIDPGMDITNQWQFDMAIPETQTSPLVLLIRDEKNPDKVTKALVLRGN